MDIVTTIKALRQKIKSWRQQGESIVLVPTMGNLHSGHIKLVKQARKKAARVVVSIFVNPTQFAVGEDFESYPKTEAEDVAKLQEIDTDLLFLPAVSEIYPANDDTVVTVTQLSRLHCGVSRAGHFDGVATIVSKLFNIVQADIAVFGEKDFQQLAVIRKLVQDLNIPVKIVGVATEREVNGLAMSSRNGYLTGKELLIAPHLYQSLCHAREQVLSKSLDLPTIEQQQKEHLTDLGFEVDYFSICNRQNLQPAEDIDDELVILVAAKLGKPRLIDNVCFSR